MTQELKHEEKKKILGFVNNFASIVGKGGWVSHYDADSDSFAIRVPKLSKDAHKRYVNDEFAFYLTKKSEVEGVFVEYFNSNLVLHHKKELQPLKQAFKDRQKKNKKSVIELKKTATRKIALGLESVLLDSMIGSIPTA